LSLDVRVCKMLDRYANLEETTEKKDHEALCYINNLPSVDNAPYLKAAYVKYYFQAKRDYKVKQSNQLSEDIVDAADVYKKDI